jgi:hypothetical protein
MPLTATERIDLALHGTEIVTAAFQVDDEPCEYHGGEGEGSKACAECREDAPRTPEDDEDPFGPKHDPDESARQWKSSGRTEAMTVVREHGGNDDDSGRDRQRFGRSAF